MNSDYVKRFIGNDTLSIVDAMERIDANAKGILFIVNGQGQLAGCLTDGDIRRWLIKTGELNASVKKAMKHSPKYLFFDERRQAESLMHKESISRLPLLDKDCKIVDIVLLEELAGQTRSPKRADLSGIPVVVMAGGKGTRLYPYTKILPKPLIPIGETPIVERIITYFTEYGIDKYYMTVNYKKGMIKSYFSELSPGYEIEFVEEEKPLGTGGSLKLIEKKLDKPFFVTNCDALILTNYGDVYDFHVKSGNDITIISALKNIVIPYGVLRSGENGVLKEIEEKPKLSYFINTGMYVLNPDVIEEIPDNSFFHMTYLVNAVRKSGGKVGMYPVSEDSFLDMGEFDEMQRMEEKLNIVIE